MAYYSWYKKKETAEAVSFSGWISRLTAGAGYVFIEGR